MAIKDIKLRTFIAEGNSRNDLAAHVYDITYGSLVSGVDNLVIIDDSIVRGTTLKQSIIGILDRLGPKKIVIVSSSPQVRYPDYYGIDMAKMSEFIAFRAAIELLKERDMKDVIAAAYRKSKDQVGLPKEQMVAGIYDIFNHICEQYFSGEDDNTSDYISEALMKSVIHSSRIAIQNPEDYEARSNIMWAATWALNTLISRGKSTDWMVHMLGQAVGAYTDATHGMTLSAVSLPYYQYIMPYGLSKFCRFAVNVWEVDPAGKADEQVAREGLSCMEVWMKELGLTMNLHELGATEEMLQGIANGTLIMEGGYKVLNHDEVLEILKNSL